MTKKPSKPLLMSIYPLEERIGHVSDITSTLVERETHGYISAQRWRNIVSGRVKKISVKEELYIDMLFRHKLRVNNAFEPLLSGLADRRRKKEEYERYQADINNRLAVLLCEMIDNTAPPSAPENLRKIREWIIGVQQV